MPKAKAGKRSSSQAKTIYNQLLATDFEDPHVEWVDGKVITTVSMSNPMIHQAVPAEALPRMTYEEFLASDFENPHVEWVDGRVVEMAPISDEHQDIGGLLEASLRAFVEEKKLGVIRHDPFQMKLGANLPGRAPDILFLSNAHRKRLKKTHVLGPADLVVEIISPDYRGRDRGEKFYEYEKGGVPEYWLIDPERKQAEFYLLNRKKLYQLAGLDSGNVFRSVALPGLWIRPAWLWAKPLPSLLWVMREWELIK